VKTTPFEKLLPIQANFFGVPKETRENSMSIIENQTLLEVASGKHTKSYGTWPIEIDGFPIKNGDFLWPTGSDHQVRRSLPSPGPPRNKTVPGFRKDLELVGW